MSAKKQKKVEDRFLIILDSEDWPLFWHAPADHASVARLRAVFVQANEIDNRNTRQSWQNTVDLGMAFLHHLEEKGFEAADLQVSLGERAIYPATVNAPPEKVIDIHEIIGIEDKKVWLQQKTYGGANMFDDSYRFVDILYTSVKN